MGFPVVPTLNLHVLPSFAVLWQKCEFCQEGTGGGGTEFSGLISFAAYLWNRIFHPPGLALPCVGWYRAYLEIRSPWKTVAQESDLLGFN